MKSADPVKRPKSMRANRADHVVGDAAARGAGSPPGSEGTTPSSDWMAELSADRQPGAAPPVEPGVPVSTRAPGDRSRGRAIESKRGQR